MAALCRATKPGSAAHTRPKDVLEVVAGRKMEIFPNTTDRGTEHLHPLNEATAKEDGWQLNGTKYFVNIFSVATSVATNALIRDTNSDHIANILIAMNTKGARQAADWNALGMRASE